MYSTLGGCWRVDGPSSPRMRRYQGDTPLSGDDVSFRVLTDQTDFPSLWRHPIWVAMLHVSVSVRLIWVLLKPVSAGHSHMWCILLLTVVDGSMAPHRLTCVVINGSILLSWDDVSSGVFFGVTTLVARCIPSNCRSFDVPHVNPVVLVWRFATVLNRLRYLRMTWQTWWSEAHRAMLWFIQRKANGFLESKWIESKWIAVALNYQEWLLNMSAKCI